MKKFLINQKNNIYFIPGVYTLLFSLLAFIMLALEQNVNLSNVPNIFTSSREYAHDFYILMIGSLLTLVTVTFSIMMVVLTVYGAQFSPRTLQDFLSKRNTLQILGFFIGTLTYSVISFFFYKYTTESSILITPTIGTILFILSLFIFAYFIHYVSKSVQINIYIQKLVKNTIDKLTEQENKVINDPNIVYKDINEVYDHLKSVPIEVKSNNSGYIQGYDHNKLINLSKEFNCIIRTAKQIGDHIFEEEIILYIYNQTQLNEEFINKLHQCIYIGEETNLYTDFGTDSKKLVEIALRALSPAVNDPETASFCIEQLGFLLEKIVKILVPIVYTDEQKQIKLVIEREHLARILYDHFTQIKIYGFHDYTIIKSTLSAIQRITKSASINQKNDLWNFTLYLVSDIDFNKIHKFHYEYLITNIYLIAKSTDKTDDFKKNFIEN